MTDWNLRAEQYAISQTPDMPGLIRDQLCLAYLSGARDRAQEALDELQRDRPVEVAEKPA